MYHVADMERRKNIIIDLRDNGGGSLYVLDEMMGELLPPGTEYYESTQRSYNRSKLRGETMENYRPKTKTLEQRRRDPNLVLHPRLADKNIVVLMDGGSASASEIMVSALKDRAAAGLGNVHFVGSRTYGKGIGQVIITRSGRKTLSVTFMAIRGITVGDYHKIGIEPDPVSQEHLDYALGYQYFFYDPEFYYAMALLEYDPEEDGLARQGMRKPAEPARAVQPPRKPGPPRDGASPVIGAYVVIDESDIH
jgi:C-terminal processing protease CtpA/Prc